MKKRKTINIIGIILIVAIFFSSRIIFPNKARIGYYVQIKDNDEMYKEGEIRKKSYLIDSKESGGWYQFSIYSKDRYSYATGGSSGWYDDNYFRPAGMYDKKITYYSYNKFSFSTYSNDGELNTIYCEFGDKYITLTDLKGQKITYKWIGLLCKPEEHEKAEYTKKYGEYILNNSEELSLKEIKENINRRYIFYAVDILLICILIFYNIISHRRLYRRIVTVHTYGATVTKK